MHYRNGREAKNGDKIIRLSVDGGKIECMGELQGAIPGNDFCNGRIVPIPTEEYACLCDCLHVDDLATILADRGLATRSTAR